MVVGDVIASGILLAAMFPVVVWQTIQNCKFHFCGLISDMMAHILCGYARAHLQFADLVVDCFFAHSFKLIRTKLLMPPTAALGVRTELATRWNVFLSDVDACGSAFAFAHAAADAVSQGRGHACNEGG